MKTFTQFRKSFHAYNVGKLNKLVELKDVREFPRATVLHLLSNVSRGEFIDATPVDEIEELIDVKGFRQRKVMCSPRLTPDGPGVKIGEKYRYRFPEQGLAKSFKEYKTELRANTIFPASDPSDIIAKNSTLNFVNYEHLFRTVVVGQKLRTYAQFELILATLINTMCSVSGEGNHYIHIPVSKVVFPVSDFSQVEHIRPGSLKYPDNYHYLTLVHLINFVNPKIEHSIFRSIPEQLLYRTTFVFSRDGKALFLNLYDFREMALKEKTIKNRLLKALNILAAHTEVNEEVDLDKVPEDAIEDILQESVPSEVTTPMAKAKRQGTNETYVQGIRSAEKAREVTETAIQDYLKEGRKKIVRSDASPLQKKRVQKLSEKYKTLKVDGKTVEEIIYGDVDVSLSDSKIESMEDRVPDKSMLKSSTMQFDKDYIEKSMEKDVLTSLVSFSAQGMFLTDIKKEYNSDELNRTVKYRVTFTDTQGKSHTSSFTVPYVDEEGKYLINGAYKYFKKQPINVPICKISSRRVSLSSSFNKTLVERNDAISHSYFNYIERVVEKLNAKGAGIELDYGHTDYKTTKPYELTSIASKYKTITIPILGKKVSLHFDGSVPLDGDERQVVDFLREEYDNALEGEYKKRKSSKTKNLKKGDVVVGNVGKLLKVSRIGDEYLEFTEYTGSQTEWDRVKLCEVENDCAVISKNGHGYLFITFDNTISMLNNSGEYKDLEGSLLNLLSSTQYSPTSMEEAIIEYYPLPVTPLTEWCKVKILDKEFPIIFVLAYRFGLRAMLDYMGVQYRVYSGNIPKDEKRTTDIAIRFKDRTLVFNRYPILHSWIFSGLAYFNTRAYEMELFDDPAKTVYFDLLRDKNMSINYIKGIDSFFDLFVDPITYDVLVQMGEPTNVRDLFIRSVSLLTTEEHRDPASMKNFRVRSYERIPAIVYNEYSRQFAQYQTDRSVGKKFSINPEGVFQKIIADAASDTMMDICNPIHQIKEKTNATYSGMSGRTGESFTEKDRIFPEDGLGTLSESTVDSGKVGISAYLTMDSNIVNTRGVIEPKDVDDLEPTELLSSSALLIPGSTCDDGKRTNFISIQLSSHIPTREGSVSRVRTGYEEIVPYRCTMPFTYIAKDDGTIIDVDEEEKLFKVQYKNGTIDVVDYSEQYTNSAGSYVTQRLHADVKKGQRVRKEDILCYNKEFFEPTGGGKIGWKHGVRSNVVFMETNETIEDSCAITEDLGQKLSISPAHERNIELDGTMVVHDFKFVGDEVSSTDPLMIVEESESAVYTDDAPRKGEEVLSQLVRSNIRAKFTGEVVKVDVFYGGDLENMSPSMRSFIRKVTKKKNKVSSFAKGTSKELEYPKPAPLKSGTKMRGGQINDGTVIVKYFIREDLVNAAGDKLCITSSLKTVCAKILPEPIVSESGVRVDMQFSGTSISNRIINSPMITGMPDRVLEELERIVVQKWKG